MKADLEYFMHMQDMALPNNSAHSVQLWDERAESWEKAYRDADRPKSDERIEDTVAYLRAQGLLDAGCEVADIGCGPGRFAAAFARTAKQVTGFDISPKMVAYGMAYSRQQGLDNVHLLVRDFQTLDIEAEELTQRFDLVFSSNTPAIHGMESLQKLMGMSRKYCCNITHLHNENELESRLMREVFGRERRSAWDGHWFYSLFNVLFLLGYYPQTSYYKQHKECCVQPDEDYAHLVMEHQLPAAERTPANQRIICRWLEEQSGADGHVIEISDTWYGRNLWEVRENIGTTLSFPKHHPIVHAQF